MRSADEAEVLESLVSNLEAQGYSVYMQPSAQVLPPFMKGYVPDLVAYGKPKNLAFEIVREGAASKKNIDEAQRRFQQADDWEFRVYYLRPTAPETSLQRLSRGTIEDSVRNVEALLGAGQSKAALLIAWATFEALGRASLPEQFVRPQTPARLIEVLASNGQLGVNDAKLLRKLADQRNRLVHGGLDLALEQEDLQRFTRILRGLIEELPTAA